MGRSERDDLFLEAISAGIRGQRVDWVPLDPQLWAALFSLAEGQKLLPILTDAVCVCPNAETDPDFRLRRGAAKRQVMLQAGKDAVFSRVYSRLREAEIDALVVKGSLCRSVYPNGALRISADEDLLVGEAQFPKACGLLERMGLRPASGEAAERGSEISWRSPDGLLELELHRFLFDPDSGPFGLLQALFTDVFSRVREYELAEGGRVLSLSPHDHLLYLLMHAMKHFIRTGFGLRQICDVGLWAARWQREIDWSLLRQQTEQVRGTAFCAALFRIAEQELKIPLDLPALWREAAPDPGPMLKDLLEGGIYGSSTQSRVHSARITQDAVTAQREGKRRSLRTVLFPPAASLEQDYPILKEHPAALPLVWQTRLLRYLKKTGGSAEHSPTEALRLGQQRVQLLRDYGILEDE